MANISNKNNDNNDKSAQLAGVQKLALAMCSIDLAESQWTQVSIVGDLLCYLRACSCSRNAMKKKNHSKWTNASRLRKTPPKINNNKELPRLPVPDLWLTVSRYLASLKAVLAPVEQLDDMLHRLVGCQLSERQVHANWQQYEHTDQLVKQFMLNEGPELQRDLKEYANKCQNWATDYWLQDMYLLNPLPLAVNSNPFFLFPRQQFANSNEMLMFATRIIQFSVDFKYRIDQQSLKQDYGSGHGKGKALCMETYKNFFHSYRMPHEDMDRLLPQSRRSNHIVVASCNQFYVLRLGQDPLDNPYRREAQNQLNETSVFEQLLRIYRVSRENAKREQATKTGQCTPKVGLLTTENRKTWAKWHKKLSHFSPATTGVDSASCSQVSKAARNSLGSGDTNLTPSINSESLRQIEDCLFVMCLDSLVGCKRQQQQLDSDNLEQAARLILTGGGTQLFTGNRWFDKFLQIIVGRNGVCGVNIEHSASEGITVLRFLEEFLQFVRSNPIGDALARRTERSLADERATDEENHFDYEQRKQAAEQSISSFSYVEPKSPSALLEESDKIDTLKWQLDEQLEAAIKQAEENVNKLSDNLSLVIFHFKHFGRAFVKRQNLSPDAFVQLALQYTFYKLHGQLVSTYESASLRQFRLGRVDNIRANTCEAFQWIQAMLRCKQTKAKVSFASADKSFIRAITKQVEILRYTIIGGGPDNHLLALRELAKIRYGADELPELFTDSSYKEFLNFRLSTSQLPNESGITVGYGAVVPDGYGCSYNPCEDKMIFCVSSFHDCKQTSSSKFTKTLEESLLEMHQLCLERNESAAHDKRRPSQSVV